MAKCIHCEKDMLKVNTCVEVPIKVGKKELKPIRYGSETRYSGSPYWPPEEGHRCHDCNVVVGGFHHPSCDMEECPSCHGQMISCGCTE